MDPDAMLKLLRDSVAEWNNANYAEDEGRAAAAAIDAAVALDHWMTMGGFPPEDWR